jgi:hypothetical protein
MYNNIQTVVKAHIPNNNTPARYYWESQTLVINEPVFAKLTVPQRIFVMLHETGHAELQTKNEIEADNFAIQEYVKLGLPLSSVINVTSDNLVFNKKNDYDRLHNQFSKLANFDIIQNKNYKLKNHIMQTPEYISFLDSENNVSDFLGLWGKSKEERLERKEQRQLSRQERKAQRQLARQQRSLVRAEDGRTLIGDLFSGTVGNVLGQTFGLLSGTEGTETIIENGNFENRNQSVSNNKTTLIIIAIVFVILIGIGIWYFAKPKKR